jgi:hypothetical protein
MKSEINPQRQKNYWEPIYEPEAREFKEWQPSVDELRHTKGIQKRIVNLDTIKKSQFTHLNEFTFENIDFTGILDGEQRKFTFRKCIFKKCSFREAEFINIKFTLCNFDQSTFALGYFRDCEFRDCNYHKIGVSGNSMTMDNCYLDPELFLKDLYLNSDPVILTENNTSIHFQKFQQAKTKAVIARKLTELQPIKNDIEFHIKSIETARKKEVLAFFSESFYKLFYGKDNAKIKNFFNLIFSMLEFPIIMLFGWLSGWGYKIGKTVFIGIICIVIFAFINNELIFQSESILESILKTFEYWLLFGYTKYDFSLIPKSFQWLIFLNSLLGMIWFAAIIPIIIN